MKTLQRVFIFAKSHLTLWDCTYTSISVYLVLAQARVYVCVYVCVCVCVCVCLFTYFFSMNRIIFDMVKKGHLKYFKPCSRLKKKNERKKEKLLVNK